MKLLSIEIPTCSKDIFEKFYKDNFRFWSKAKDKIVFNINFQGYTEDDIAKYISYTDSLGLEVHYCVSEYIKGSPLPSIREQTHQIYPECPFNMTMDDDIAVLTETYVDTVMNIVDIMCNDETIGVATIRNRYPSQDPIIFIDEGVQDPYTYGGIIFRNREDKRMCPPEYMDVVGLQDALFTLKKMSEGYKRLTCKIGDSHFHHYEIRKEYAPGMIRHNWKITDRPYNEIRRLICYMMEHDLCNVFFKIPQ